MFRFILLLTTICVFAVSSNAEETEYEYFYEGNLEGPVVSGLVCARTILEKKLGGERGVGVASEIVNDIVAVFRANKDRSSKLAELTQISEACMDIKGSMDKVKVSRNAQINKVKTAPVSLPTKLLLEGFLKPTITCWKSGIGAGAAIGLSVAAKVDVAYCRATNGRQWLQLSLGGGGGLGIGIVVDVNWGKYQDTDVYRKSLYGVHSSRKAAVAAVLGMSAEDFDSSSYGILNVKISERSEEANGYTFGLAGYAAQLGQIDIKYVPLGTDEEFLMDYFKVLVD